MPDATTIIIVPAGISSLFKASELELLHFIFCALYGFYFDLVCGIWEVVHLFVMDYESEDI